MMLLGQVNWVRYIGSGTLGQVHWVRYIGLGTLGQVHWVRYIGSGTMRLHWKITLVAKYFHEFKENKTHWETYRNTHAIWCFLP